CSSAITRTPGCASTVATCGGTTEQATASAVPWGTAHRGARVVFGAAQLLLDGHRRHRRCPRAPRGRCVAADDLRRRRDRREVLCELVELGHELIELLVTELLRRDLHRRDGIGEL